MSEGWRRGRDSSAFAASRLLRDFIVSASHLAVARVRLRASVGGWRRGRDSNPRNRSRFSGFQDHRHRPLGHLSNLDWRGPLHPAWRPSLACAPFRSLVESAGAPTPRLAHFARSPFAARSAPFACRIGGGRLCGAPKQPSTCLRLRGPRLAHFARLRSVPFAWLNRRDPLLGAPKQPSTCLRLRRRAPPALATFTRLRSVPVAC